MAPPRQAFGLPARPSGGRPAACYPAASHPPGRPPPLSGRRAPFTFSQTLFFRDQVPQAVLFGDLADDAAGVAGRQHPVRDIVQDHAARADHHIVADGHAADNRHAAADPDIVADPDGLGVFGDGGQTVIPAQQPQPFVGQQGMGSRHQRNVGGDHHVISDINIGVIQYTKVVVGKKVLPDVGVQAVVELHRTLEVEPFPDLAQNGAHQRGSPLVVFVQRVVQAAGLVRFVLGIPQLHRIGPEQQSRPDFLGLLHVVSSSVF